MHSKQQEGGIGENTKKNREVGNKENKEDKQRK